MGKYLDYFIENSEAKKLLQIQTSELLHIADELHTEYLQSIDRNNSGKPFCPKTTKLICTYGARINEELCFRADENDYCGDWLSAMKNILPRLSAYYRRLQKQGDVLHLYSKYSVKLPAAINHEFLTSVAATYLDICNIDLAYDFLKQALKLNNNIETYQMQNVRLRLYAEEDSGYVSPFWK